MDVSQCDTKRGRHIHIHTIKEDERTFGKMVEGRYLMLLIDLRDAERELNAIQKEEVDFYYETMVKDYKEEYDEV